MNKTVEHQDLGMIDYQKAWDYQEKVFKEIIELKVQNRSLDESMQTPTPNYIFTCEHPHVYTLGKSGQASHLLVTEEELSHKKTNFYRINRGGDITYHGPGQLVIYPILDLDNFFTDIHRYLRYLEEAVIKTLLELNIIAGRIEGLTGVWIGMDTYNPRKICALGVRSSRWVVMHGLALNVNTDLSYFQNIIPCGINDKAVTSISNELGKSIDLSYVSGLLINNIAQQFGFQIINPLK